MPKNRFGHRQIPKDLEVNRGVTIKLINLDIKDLGYMMKFTGYEPKYEFPTYAVYPIYHRAPPLDNNSWRVYALGDYTVVQWRHQIMKRLKEQCPEDCKRLARRARTIRWKRNKKQNEIRSKSVG